MKSRKIISLFLFLVLSIQVLPFRQIATWLSANPFSEEIPCEIGTMKAKSAILEINSDFQNFHAPDLSAHPGLGQSNPHHEEALILRHPDDVISPPPNDLPSPA